MRHDSCGHRTGLCFEPSTYEARAEQSSLRACRNIASTRCGRAEASWCGAASAWPCVGADAGAPHVRADAVSHRLDRTGHKRRFSTVSFTAGSPSPMGSCVQQGQNTMSAMWCTCARPYRGCATMSAPSLNAFNFTAARWAVGSIHARPRVARACRGRRPVCRILLRAGSHTLGALSLPPCACAGLQSSNSL